MSNAIEMRRLGVSMNQKKGSFLLGILGAFLGAILAMIPYGIAYHFGYLVFYFGFLFALIPAAGYNLLGGRKSYLKIPIVFVFGLIAIVATIVIPLVLDLVKEDVMASFGLTNWDIPQFILEYMNYDEEFKWGIYKDLGGSLLIYLIGTAIMIKDCIKEVRALKAEEQHREYQELYGVGSSVAAGQANPGFQQPQQPMYSPAPTINQTAEENHYQEERRREEEVTWEEEFVRPEE